jgi:hypothetical protein
MSPTQVKRIIISGAVVVGGIVYFSYNRRKKFLVKTLIDTINDRSPKMDYTTVNQGGGYGNEALASQCTMNKNQVDNSVATLRDSQYGAFLWMGTKEEKMIQEIKDIGTKACWAKVSSEYKKKYESPLYADLKGEYGDGENGLVRLNDAIASLI